MANMTTWIYLPWDGRYLYVVMPPSSPWCFILHNIHLVLLFQHLKHSFDLIANDEASLIVNKASGGRAPLRSASAWRTLYGDTQTLVVRQTYDLVEGMVLA